MTETEIKAKLERAEEQTHQWRCEAYDYAHQIARLRSQVARLEAELNLAQAKLALAGAK